MRPIAPSTVRLRRGCAPACQRLHARLHGNPDRQERSQHRDVFGDYLHRYLIDQAVKDGATVPIFYEMRDARLRIDGHDLEQDIRAAFPNCQTRRLRTQRGMRLQEKARGRADAD